MAMRDLASALAKLKAMKPEGAGSASVAAEPAAEPAVAPSGAETRSPADAGTGAVPAASAAPPASAVPGASALLGLSAAMTARTAVAAAPALAPSTAPAHGAQQQLLPAPTLPSSDALPKELADAVQSLANALHAQEPGIDSWLERIHEQLRAYPELTHILTPEQVRAVCSGWLAKTQTAVVASASKARSGAKAAKLTGKAPISDADL